MILYRSLLLHSDDLNYLGLTVFLITFAKGYKKKDFLITFGSESEK